MRIEAWSLFVLCYCCAIQRSSQVFRFCHRGMWHQILEDDCPHGLLFNEQLQTPCFYTKGVDRTVPRIWTTICDEPYMNSMGNLTDATAGDGFFLAQKNGEIRMIQFGLSDDNAKPANADGVISLQSCEDRCYRNVFEYSQSSPLFSSSSHEASDSLEAPHHIARPQLSPNDQMAITDQTLRLGDYLFDQIATPEENPGPKLRIVQLFKKTIAIMGKTCQHPFVNNKFLTRVLYGFLFLVSEAGIGELEDISVEEFEEIMVALNGCDEKAPDFRLEGSVCETSAIVKEVIKILPNGTEYSAPFQLTQGLDDKEGKSNVFNKNERRTAFRDPDYEDEKNLPTRRSFPYDELDIFTEAAWSAVQVTHASCFATFKRNANMHHRYVSAMEQLFSGKIQDRWRNPTRLIDDRMWGTWFLADVDLTFTNLQACIRASYLNAPFSMRLDRPIDPARSPDKRRRKRAASSDIGERYWEIYSDGGGIRYKLADEIQCFQNPDDRQSVLTSLKEQCQTL